MQILVISKKREHQWGAGHRFNTLIRGVSGVGQPVVWTPDDVSSRCKSGSRSLRSRVLRAFGVPTELYLDDVNDLNRCRRDLRDKIHVTHCRLIVVYYSEMMKYVPRDCAIPVIIDTVDILWVKNGYNLIPKDNPYIRGFVRRCKYQFAMAAESAIMNRADVIWVCSDVDQDHVTRSPFVRRPRTRIVENSISSAGVVTRVHRNPRRVVFVGTFGYNANRDGARWLIREVLPVIRETGMEVEVELAGPWPDWVDISDYQAPEVVVSGYVESIVDVYRRSSLVVCPLRFGSGTRLKIIEAWSYGCPVLSTSKGAEGLLVRRGVNIEIEDEPHAYAMKMITLLGDEGRLNILANAGHHTLAAFYSSTVISEKISSILEMEIGCSK